MRSAQRNSAFSRIPCEQSLLLDLNGLARSTRQQSSTASGLSRT
jgi:hypothetical protein